MRLAPILEWNLPVPATDRLSEQGPVVCGAYERTPQPCAAAGAR